MPHLLNDDLTEIHMCKYTRVGSGHGVGKMEREKATDVQHLQIYICHTKTMTYSDSLVSFRLRLCGMCNLFTLWISIKHLD